MDVICYNYLILIGSIGNIVDYILLTLLLLLLVFMSYNNVYIGTCVDVGVDINTYVRKFLFYYSYSITACD